MAAPVATAASEVGRDWTMPASCAGAVAPRTTPATLVGHSSKARAAAPGRAAGPARHPDARMLRDPQRPFAPPADATDVLLVRHGSAGGPAPGEPPELVGGHTDVPLSPAGHVQAGALARRLESVSVAAIFVSTLRRTAETAAPLAA